MVEEAKRRAAAAAVAEVDDGMVLGLGSGTTAALAIRTIGDDGYDVVGVPTSYQAADVAREADVSLARLADVDRIDLAIDGADQVADGHLVKGGGGAHVREKLVASAARRFVVVVDDSKRVDVLDRAVPLAVLPDAERVVRESVADLGGRMTLRSGDGKVGPVVSDDGHLLADTAMGRIEHPANLATALAAIPGVVDHGLFVGMADAIYVGSVDGVERLDR